MSVAVQPTPRIIVRQHGMFHRVFRAEPLAVRQVLIDLRLRFHADAGDEPCGRMELVVAEVLNNIAEHGGRCRLNCAQVCARARVPSGTGTRPDGLSAGGEAAGSQILDDAADAVCIGPRIHLSVVRHRTGLACAITDDGLALPADCLALRRPPDPQPGDDLPEGGFGWFLIQNLTQSLCYYREGERNFLAFSIPWRAAQMTGA